MKAKTTVLGQPSWRLATNEVEAYVTELGGHLAPVTFDVQGRKIMPYAVAPWAEEKLDPELPPVLQSLRGDFFCMPFGGNEKPFRGERHPAHGETANAKWKLESQSTADGRSCLHLSLETKVRAGHVDKRICLIEGHNALYCQHVISGMSGLMNPGHHATLQFPDEPNSGLISTSPFVYGQVYPQPVEQPENKGYCCLKPGFEFDSLREVPTITGEIADLSRFPARRGFGDLAMVVSDVDVPFAWTAVAFPKQRYAWFALKDPRVLRNTVFWIANGGRHYAPWNGRHINVMGLEEVTSYFHPGLAESAGKNPLSEKGFPTCLRLDAKQPLVVNYIMAVAPIPASFDHVASIEASQDNSTVTLTSSNGKRVNAPIDVNFLQSPPL